MLPTPALYRQHRHICQGVEKQLGLAKDEEKGSIASRDNGILCETAAPGSQGTLTPDLNDADKSIIEDDTAAKLPGVSAHQLGGNGTDHQYLVDWDGPDDPHHPRNWPISKRVACILQVSAIVTMVIIAAFIESSTAPQAAEELHVSEVAESLATALFLVGFACGVLLSGPLCEYYGRGLVYFYSLILFMIWTMASALTPNFAGQITFRFLAGFCGSPPLTVAGGSIADLLNLKERTWAFPIFGIWAFGGPVLGPVVGAWIGPSPYLSWRWSDWICLIGTGVVFVVVCLFLPETMPSRLLQYKAAHIRNITGDNRYRTQYERDAGSLGQVMKNTVFRPFVLLTEPIIFWLGLYMFLVYMELLSFVFGYTFVFSDTYGFGQGITESITAGIFVGVLLGCIMVYPAVIYTNRELVKRGDDGTGSAMRPEIRLLYAMWGAPAIPISLFWMGWTNSASITPWSGILASVLFGFGLISVYLSSFLYIMDSYGQRASGALASLTFLRYLAASGLSTAGFPFYAELGVPWSLTLLGALSVVLRAVPYVLYCYGPEMRKRSVYTIT